MANDKYVLLTLRVATILELAPMIEYTYQSQ